MTTHHSRNPRSTAGPGKRVGFQPLVSGSVGRLLLLGGGWLSLGLAAIGVVLPVLPTTPFVILSAFCFAKSSPALADRLNRSRLFGPIIADWRASGAIAPRYKSMALLMMAGALGVSFALSVPVGVLVVQGIFMAAAATFILSRPNQARVKADGQPCKTAKRNHS